MPPPSWVRDSNPGVYLRPTPGRHCQLKNKNPNFTDGEESPPCGDGVRVCVGACVRACVSHTSGSCGRHSRYLRQPGETGGVFVPVVAVRSCPPCVVAVIVQVA